MSEPWGQVEEIRVKPGGDEHSGGHDLVALRILTGMAVDTLPWLVVCPGLVSPTGEGSDWASDAEVADWTVVR